MCKQKIKTNRAHSAFTLLEMLLVISLTLLLAGLIFPTIGSLRKRAEGAVCTNNLRQIGLAVELKVQDNGNIYPYIDGDNSSKIYPGTIHENEALSLEEILKPHGIATAGGSAGKSLRCPSDAAENYLQSRKGSSYEWYSIIDGESAASAKIYISGGTLLLPLWRFPLAGDYESVHLFGSKNILFADGHVEAYTGLNIMNSVK